MMVNGVTIVLPELSVSFMSRVLALSPRLQYACFGSLANATELPDPHLYPRTLSHLILLDLPPNLSPPVLEGCLVESTHSDTFISRPQPSTVSKDM